MGMKVSGSGSSGSHSDEMPPEIMAEINITPLTDVFLVLLIIFMVTSSVMTQMGVNVHLPQASHTTTQTQPEGVIVTLLPGGDLKLNQIRIAKGHYEQLETALKGLFTKTTSRLVILDGDRQAFLGNAIQVMDAAKKAGAEKFAIATSPEKSSHE